MIGLCTCIFHVPTYITETFAYNFNAILPFSIQILPATDIDLSIHFHHAAGISQPGIESGSLADRNDEAPAPAELLPLPAVASALTATTPPQLQREVNQRGRGRGRQSQLHMQRA